MKDLRVVNARSGRPLVKGVSFAVGRGETVALVGESGSGKSLTAKALMDLVPTGLSCSGSARLLDTDLITAGQRKLRRLRGSGVSLLLQDPFTMLNPLIRVRTVLGETLPASPAGTPRRSRAQVTEEIDRRLAEVGIAMAGAARAYPWELSGGMRQRVGLAAAIAKEPVLLIADEPTTALDATTQREVLRLLRRIQRSHGMGLLLITHDLQVAFAMSDRVLVISDGELVEQGEPQELIENPQTEYTKQLLAAELPLHHRRQELLSRGATAEVTEHSTVDPSERSSPATGDSAAEALTMPDSSALLRVRGLKKTFTPSHGREVWALQGIDMDLRHGRSVGVIGESGSGKTTLARCLLGLETPTSGTIEADSIRLDLPGPRSRQRSARARELIQCVFQDPYSSLNPSHRVGYILGEAIRLRTDGRVAAKEVKSEASRLLAQVGLPASLLDRRPPTLSGGQRQRIAVARALAMRPRVLVCDEPVAALDFSVQAQVLQVLRDVQTSGVSLLLITHDLTVARQMTDELVVLHRGEVVERGLTAEVIDHPQHEYTQRLIAAVPTGSPDWLAER
ncbi:ABC transporter ATP-binding protein [Streptomyces oryzae]|uniref:ABC transporter ATP-binding protein n=1 Tax=Streptomyces oryzae TaxID=1434886 RepID=UPI0027DE29AB|nr:ABC transporter ATP-binding protein [Streptomyces oryzae]